MAAESHVLVERDGPVLVVTIDHPDRRNAFTAAVLAQLWRSWLDFGVVVPPDPTDRSTP